MANEAKKTPCEIAKEAYDAAIKAANDALGKNPVDLVAYNAAMGALDKAEKDYAKAKALEMYDEYAKKSNPIVEIIKAYSYETLAHKEKRSDDKDNPRVIAINPDTRKRQIDLLAFCSRAKLDTHWELTASCFNQLMCLRAAKELGADVDKIAKSYFLKEKAREIKLGKTPTSNTQVCKLLQTVIDEILPCNDDDTPVYKCNNYDVAYLDDLYGKKSNKNMLTVRVSNDSFFRRILVDICYRLVTNSKYGVDGYKGYKDEAAAE